VGVDTVLSDVDSPLLSSITIEITNLLDGVLESLAVDVGTTGITTDNSVAGRLVLNGPATVTEFETVLKTVEYENLSSTPDLTPRKITFEVNDGIDDSTLATSIVSISPDNARPIANNITGGISLNEGATGVITSGMLSYRDLQPAGSISYTVVTAPVNE